MTTPPRPSGGQRITTPSRDWRQLAACRPADPELFFPVSASGPSLDQITQAKAICAGCPVRQQCLAFALDTRQNHGVWGGMSEEERRPRARNPVAGPDTRACDGHAEPPGTRSSAPDRDQHIRVRGGDLPGDSLDSHEVVLTAQGP